MGFSTTVLLVTGDKGSGKTYVRCACFLAEEWLPHHDGVHWSNFPVKVPELAAYVLAKHKVSVEETTRRVQVIPREVMDSWARGESGPWEFFADKELQGVHIAIDECHHYCPRGGRGMAEHRRRWSGWLSEIRHRGATVEFLTQHPQKLAREIENEAGLRISLTSSETRRDPWFRIVLSDWYELQAKFLTGEYRPSIWEVERRCEDGRWVVEDKRVWWRSSDYYGLYDSYSAPQLGGRAGHAAKQEFQKRSALGLLWWFFRRNWFRVGTRAVVVAVVVFMVSGGGGRVGEWWMGSIMKVGGSAMGKVGVPAAGAPATGPAVAGVGKSDAGSGEASALRKKLGELEKQLAEVDAERERRSAVVLLDGQRCILRGGGEYRMGDVIRDGRWEGRRIVWVGRRDIRLEGGAVLGLGAMAEPTTKPVGKGR